MELRPLKDRILVKRLQEEMKEQIVGGIILAPTAYKLPNEGDVVALGEGIRTKAGTLVPFDLKIGDRVLFQNSGGKKISFNGEEYLSFEEDEILGVIEFD